MGLAMEVLTASARSVALTEREKRPLWRDEVLDTLTFLFKKDKD